MDFYMKLSRCGYAQHHVHGFPDVHDFDDCGNLGRKPRNHNGAVGELLLQVASELCHFARGRNFDCTADCSPRDARPAQVPRRPSGSRRFGVISINFLRHRSNGRLPG